MGIWYQTIWGIILLGAIGSLLAVLILKIVSIIVNRIGTAVIERLASNLLMSYAENIHFIKMCEENDKLEFISVRYNLTMGKYSRVQVVFVFSVAISLIMWVSYFSSNQMTIFVPILFSIMAITDLYVFIKWYLAVTGCFPSDMKSYSKQIEILKKEDKIKFVKEALK